MLTQVFVITGNLNIPGCSLVCPWSHSYGIQINSLIKTMVIPQPIGGSKHSISCWTAYVQGSDALNHPWRSGAWQTVAHASVGKLNRLLTTSSTPAYCADLPQRPVSFKRQEHGCTTPSWTSERDTQEKKHRIISLHDANSDSLCSTSSLNKVGLFLSRLLIPNAKYYSFAN